MLAIANKQKGIKSKLIYFNMDSAFDAYEAQLLSCSYFDDVIGVKDLRNRKIKGLKEVLANIFFYRKQVNKYFDRFVEKGKLEELIGDSEINVFSTTLLFQKYLFFNFGKNYFRILEDGLIVYREIKNPITRAIKLIHGIPDRPADSFFKEIWVSQPDQLPNKARAKSKKFELTDLVENLSREKKKEVVDFFLKDLSIQKNNIKNALIITQPLSEDNFISEQYKINLYKKIAREYKAKGYQVYLKNHPREKTSYQEVIPEIDGIIPGSFPLEVLNLNQSVQFDKGITIFSSALHNCNFINEKVFLGESWDPKIHSELQKRFKM